MKIQIYLVPAQPAPIQPAPVQPPPAPASESTAKSNPGTCSAPLPYVLYHYTTQEKLAQILSTDVIKPSTTRLEPNEKPVVWFSTSSQWEPTATKCLLTGKLGQVITAAAQGGLARIAVRPGVARHGLRELPLLALTPTETCMGLVLAGLKMGADPAHWRFSLEPVYRKDWQAIELFDFEHSIWLDAGLLTETGSRSSSGSSSGSLLTPAQQSELAYMAPRASGAADSESTQPGHHFRN